MSLKLPLLLSVTQPATLTLCYTTCHSLLLHLNLYSLTPSRPISSSLRFSFSPKSPLSPEEVSSQGLSLKLSGRERERVRKRGILLSFLKACIPMMTNFLTKESNQKNSISSLSFTSPPFSHLQVLLSLIYKSSFLSFTSPDLRSITLSAFCLMTFISLFQFSFSCFFHPSSFLLFSLNFLTFFFPLVKNRKSNAWHD